MQKKILPIVLVILDGWGIRAEKEHNAISQAHTPVFNQLLKQYPNTQLHASGQTVGLPRRQMGNSEVGHMTLAAGRIIPQELVRINAVIASGDFSKNSTLIKLFQHVTKCHSQLHVLGLLSAGGVHSHQSHFFAAIKAAHAYGIQRIVLHPFLDGRDVAPTSGAATLKQLERLLRQLGVGEITSVSGRYYAMDRDTNWERTQQVFAAIFYGKGQMFPRFKTPSLVVKDLYQKNIFDEHIKPMVFENHNGKINRIESNDGIFFINFRKDRARQLSQKISEAVHEKNLRFVTLSDYGKDIAATALYEPVVIENTLGELIADNGLRQARIAETEKYPHVTYFFNGEHAKAFKGETDILIPSRKDIATHDQAPEMRAREITDAVITHLSASDFIVVNFANADMVGHSGNLKATVMAVETVDRELKRLVEAILKTSGVLIITADHGNAEEIVHHKTHEPHTAHTTYPVPFIFVHPKLHPHLRKYGGLVDIAPTILELFKIKKPSVMTGKSLLLT